MRGFQIFQQMQEARRKDVSQACLWGPSGQICGGFSSGLWVEASQLEDNHESVYNPAQHDF
jgi:hypothetical protein